MLNKNIEKREIGDGQMGLFAQKNIKKGNVIWRLDSSEKILTKDERDNLPQKIRKFAFQYKSGYIVVRDGSEYMNHSCRITGRDCLNQNFQKKYKGHLPSWVKEYINNR